MVGESSLHRRRNAESLMYAAEIEKSHIEINGGGQMLQRLAESQAQTCEAAQMRSHAQVGAFDVRSTDVRFVRVAANDYRNGCRDFRRLIPVWPCSVIGSVQLDELSEINVGSK